VAGPKAARFFTTTTTPRARGAGTEPVEKVELDPLGEPHAHEVDRGGADVLQLDELEVLIDVGAPSGGASGWYITSVTVIAGTATSKMAIVGALHTAPTPTRARR